MTEIETESTVTKILDSKKYSGIKRSIIERIIKEKITNHKKQGELVKAVKNEIHIIHESFLTQNCHAKALELLDNYAGKDIIRDKSFSANLMRLHASTSERTREAEEIYAFIGKYIEEDDHIIDLGCGFNPFALPYYIIHPKKYTAYDISSTTTSIIEKYFKLANVNYRTGILDAAVQIPDIKGDVLLMLKLVPLLEHQKKGRSLEIIKTMSAGANQCRVTIVSFPTKSASGKEKGMETFYSNQFENSIRPDFTIKEKKVFHNEMFYAIISA